MTRILRPFGPRFRAMQIVISSTCIALLFCAAAVARAEDQPLTLTEDDGYRGIWYAVGKTKDEYAYKYSGGMATYPHQQGPIAVYAPAVNKTFFVYGGTVRGKRQLLHMVSHFDHATGTVPKPRILLNKKTDDAHDNPSMAIDRTGYLWIFSNSHGTSRPSFIHRSSEPYSIESFVRVLTTNFSYSQPWALDDGSLLLMHTHYQSGRGLFWMTSRDGHAWSEPAPLASVVKGHYQVSSSDGRRVATFFDFHPEQGGLDARTNLYYLESRDQGRSWLSADGTAIKTPLTVIQNSALVRDYQSEHRLVYLKDVRFDQQGHPLVLYLTSGGHEPGPSNDPRLWRITRWTGKAWETHDVTTSDHNYDCGPLYLEDDGTWRIIAPTEPGPQPYCTGGQMVMWTSADQGRTWQKGKQLTHDTRRNHSYARRPIAAQADFYALWADGDTHQPSSSSLYFTDRLGTQVWRLPTRMTSAAECPEIAW